MTQHCQPRSMQNACTLAAAAKSGFTRLGAAAMKHVLLVDQTGPLPPSQGEWHAKCRGDQAGRGVQRLSVIKRPQLAPANLFEDLAGLDPALDVGAFAVLDARLLADQFAQPRLDVFADGFTHLILRLA